MKKILLVVLAILAICESYSQVVFGRNQGQSNGGVSINYSSPKEYEIADIEVRGVQFLDNNALISLSGLRVGDKIKVPGDEITQAIKKLWNQGIIGNVSIFASKVEGDKIWLVIELSERPRLTKYIIEGVSKTKQGEIEDKIGLIRGKVLTDVVIKNTELAVMKYMESKGFLNAEIDVFQQADTILRNSAYLKIVIDQGQKVKIRNIRFDGNEAFTSAKLRSKFKKTGMVPKFSLPTEIIETTAKMIWPPNLFNFIKNSRKVSKEEMREYMATHVNLNFFKAAKFVKEDYEADKDFLIGFYNSKGYRDAEIIADTTYDISNKYMNIDLKVDEGDKYYFRNISWTGNYVYSDDQLSRILAIEKGDVYDLDLVNKKLNFNPNGADISSLYMDDGYLFFSINPVEVGVQQDSIDLEMRVYEGAQATIDKVIISGNNKTNDHVILRELRTRPGDKFSRAELIRTQRELSQLGYFDPEQVNPVPIPDPINETVDIEWQLVERSNDQIELSGGWGGAFGFVGTFGVTFNNFSVRNITKPENWRGLPVGDGQSLSLRFQANGRNFQSYSFSFVEPWLGGRKPNSFGLSYSKSIQRSINRFSNETLGWLKVTGVSASLGRRVKWPDDFFTVSTGVSYQRYDLFQFGSRSLGFNTGDANSFTLNTTIARNSVNQPMYPRNGSSLSLSASFTPPFSLWRDLDYENATPEQRYKWLEYHKWNFDSKYYLTLAGKLVLAARAHFGYIGSYTSTADVGPFERFQLGGDGLTGQNFLLGTDVVGLRGYPNNSITPFDQENNIEGGTLFNKYVMEVRYPISLAQSATIYALTFVEGGNNWDRFAEFNPYNIKKSAGVGLRIFMPAFGLMGIDWAYGFDRVPGTLQNAGPQFHFSIGQQIR
ncbi:Beta-barrel assembly machine subunit BamA [Ekhidna lutea]|uniref:Beta-barrel assembly machine subunit BamA n=1 Tax=Ekhidna lutea TaxID=447679 RepID=A0A239F1X6_EKHLU|nr:POTRA domain-containing protein [Ekhidna lutea]SNS50548.1 Beta-barrel assembly machine subunit BamA [Ekhidna lutea]